MIIFKTSDFQLDSPTADFADSRERIRSFGYDCVYTSTSCEQCLLKLESLSKRQSRAQRASTSSIPSINVASADVRRASESSCRVRHGSIPVLRPSISFEDTLSTSSSNEEVACVDCVSSAVAGQMKVGLILYLILPLTGYTIYC